MSSNTLFYMFIILSAVILGSCKSKKALIKELEALDIQAKTKASEIIPKIKAADFDFEWISAKIKTKYKTSGGDGQSFTTYLKIRKDSIIWATITYLNIPVMTSIITPDSVKVLNKKDKKYFLGSIDYVTDVFKVPIDYYQIQNLLVGNPISLDTTEDHYLVDIDDDIYLSSLKQSELAPILKGEKIHFGWVYRYWINELFKTGKTILDNPGRGNSLEITQTDYNKKNGMLFPNKTRASFVSQKDSIDIRINYNKVKVDVPQTLKFSIPSRYTPYEE